MASDRARARAFLEGFFSFARMSDEKGICLLRDGEVIAATMYYNWNGSNIWMHTACRPGRRSLTRDYIRWCFHYPFVQLNANRVSAWVHANNLASRRFVEHLGFEHEATLEGAGQDGVDALVYRLFRDQCRYV